MYMLIKGDYTMINEIIEKYLNEESPMEKDVWGVLDAISITNNGKLLLSNLNTSQKKLIPYMMKKGYIVKATFMNSGDSVAWTDKGIMRWNPKKAHMYKGHR